MKVSIPTPNGTIVASLFQLAAHLEDLVAAGGLYRRKSGLSRTIFKDLRLHPEELGAALKSAATGNDSTDTPRINGSGPGARAPHLATSSKRKRLSGNDRDGHSAGELRKVEFSLAAPAAHSVRLVADFTHWAHQPIEMMRSPDGIWFTVVPLVPGSYSYRFLVDDEWQDDPRCTRRVPNAFGTENAVILVK